MERGKKVPKYTQLPTLGYIWGLNNLLKFTWKGLPHAIMWCSPMWISVPKWKGSLLVYPKQKTKKKRWCPRIQRLMSLKPLVSFGFWSQRVWKGLLPNSKKKRKGLLPFGNNISQEKWCWLYARVSQYTNLILFGRKYIRFLMHVSFFSHKCGSHTCGIYPHVRERGCIHQKHHIPPPYSEPLGFYLWIRKVLR